MKLSILFAILCWIVSSPIFADTLILEGIQEEPVNSISGLPRPTKGMNMQRVKEIFGAPARIQEAVGQPPITRWSYDQFMVVFESDRVIHTVVKKQFAEN